MPWTTHLLIVDEPFLWAVGLTLIFRVAHPRPSCQGHPWGLIRTLRAPARRISELAQFLLSRRPWFPSLLLAHALKTQRNVLPCRHVHCLHGCIYGLIIRAKTNSASRMCSPLTEYAASLTIRRMYEDVWLSFSLF